MLIHKHVDNRIELGVVIMKGENNSTKGAEESQNGLGWKEPQRSSSFNPPAMCTVANYQTRLPRATSSLALNTSRGGASTTSLGNLFQWKKKSSAAQKSKQTAVCAGTEMGLGGRETMHCSLPFLLP